MSLRARLLLLVLVATLLPALLLGWRFVRADQTEVAKAVRSLAQSANNLAGDIDHRIQGTAQLHFGLAHSRVLDSDDRIACSAYLSQVREAYPQYTGIITVRPSGALHCDSLQSGRDLDLRDRGYYRQAMASAAPLILEPVFGRLTGNSVLQVVHPARQPDGRLRFLLVASLNLKKLVDEAQRTSLLAESALLLLDAQGTVMAAAGPVAGLPALGSSATGTPLGGLAGGGGVSELAGADGLPWVWAVAAPPALQQAGLRLLLGQPRHVLVAASAQRLRQELMVLALAALLLFGGVWALAEWGIRRQVARITSMVKALGQGELAARIALPYPRGELGGLMATLNGTADSLQQQRRAIDELAARLRSAHERELLERRQNEDRLSRMANFDSLTGLPNRTLFRDRLHQALARSRHTGQPLALMFLDIDRFKNINDSLGHDVGDRLLQAVAAVLAPRPRDASATGAGRPGAAGEEVFRLGGDEFMVLAEGADGQAAAAIAQRIVASLARPFVLGEHELFVSASIGIAMGGAVAGPDPARDSVDADALVKQADLAMYRAKEMGRDTWCFFDERMNQAMSQRHRMEVRLRHALARGEFVLHYQPKADLRSGRVTGVEALLRWQPAGEALVPPDHFIGILEETGLIVAVGAWVFREACRQCMAWQAAGMRPIGLAVNLSARQFRHQHLVEQIAEVLRDTGFEAARLEVELTESMLVHDLASAARILAELRAMGVTVAVDDFGTGQSSLRYLKRFAIDALKIDRSFVRDTPDDPEDSAITTAVIALGHGLGLRVVAEGVETAGQLDFLRRHGCDAFQGYLMSRPLDAAAFPGWLAQHDQALEAALGGTFGGDFAGETAAPRLAAPSAPSATRGR